MPLLTGTAIFHSIKGLLLHKDMKIVITTANPHMADESMQEKAEFILQKPFDVIEFQALIKKISPFLSRFTASNSASA